MNTSKLAIALISALALPLGALAQGSGSYGQSGSQADQSGQSGQYGTSGTSQTQSGTTGQSGTGQSGMGGQSGMSGQRGSSAVGAEGSAGLPMFDTLDSNKDSYVSKSELKRLTNDRNFRNLDTDRDGKLSRDEWQTGQQGTSQ